MNKEIYLTWVRPTSDTIHIWNYFWAIKPMLDYAKKNDNLDSTYIFIADLHWVIWKNYKNLSSNIVKQYSIYKAMWFKNIFVQSNILEITQISRYLESYINLWKLKRLHTIKEIEKNTEFWKIWLDYFTYPVLMSADILGIWANKVFLWKDQKQHLEVTKEIYKKLKIKDFVLPEWIYFWNQENEVIWLDWRKMSKSYNNYINPFTTDKELLKQINLIQTDNIPLGETKDFNNCNIIKIFKLFKTKEDKEYQELEKRYKEWTIWYWEAKKILFKVIKDYFKEIKEKKEEIEKKTINEIFLDIKEVEEKISKRYNEKLNKIKEKYFLN